MKRIIFSAIIVALIVGSDAGFLEAVDVGGGGTPVLEKGSGILGQPVSTKININNISAWYQANDSEERNPTTTNAGLDYPRGTSQSIYAAGLMYSGQFNDGVTPVIRTNGHAYNSGFQRGAILGTRTGVIEDPDADDVRIWRIRRDYNSADLQLDAAELNSIAFANVNQGQIDAVRAQYAKDWLEWPAHKGAPFYDADNDGVYTPSIVGGVPVLFPAADEPGIADADQVVWFVANDIGGRSPWGATPAGGLELQLAIWGYARSDALGEVIFKKYKLIYKGTSTTPASATIDSMYLSQWADPDLGSASDDYAGCDTVLSLGFVYNGAAVDAQYAQFSTVAAPPATGYDFLQGPLVQGIAGQDLNKNGVDDAIDTVGIFDLKRAPAGYINLPMTAFIYFAAGGAYSDPPFNYSGALQWNCMLKGFPPTPQPPPCPIPPTDPFSGSPAGKYWLYAGSDGSSAPNPNAPNGWVDGQIEGPGDRRIILASGPFTMAVGDTQELVSAVVGGAGTTYLKSTAVMKFNDRAVQQAYNALFELPKPPPAPDLKITALDGKLFLDWESNDVARKNTEETEFLGGYKFEGYKVYQFPTQGSNLSDGTLLGVFDLSEEADIDAFGMSVKTIFQETFDLESGEILNLPVQFGTDSGVRRTLVVDRDEFRSAPMVNGTPYYFGVTAYNFTADPTIPLKTLESSPLVVTGIPATPNPGTRYPYEINDTLAVMDQTGANDAVVSPVIFTPTRQFGETYEIHFDTLPGGVSFVWNLFKTGLVDTIFGPTPLAADTLFHSVANGFDLTVMPPPQGVKSVLDQNGENVFGPSDIPDDATYRILGKSTDLNDLAGGGQKSGRTYKIEFTTDSSFVTSIASPVFSSKAIKVPFKVYDMGRSSEDDSVQVMAVVRDKASTSSVWDIQPTLLNQDGTDFAVFEPLYISTISYVPDDPLTPEREDSTAVKGQQTNLIAVANATSNVRNAVDSIYVADLDGDGLPPGFSMENDTTVVFTPGVTVFFNKYREVRAGDVKTIEFASVTSGSVPIARDDVTLVNVFPNPYYGLNTRETSSQARFVTFNHLPAQATIRIFNLAGVLVRTLVKDAGTTNATSPQHFQWNLQNDSGLPVASGIYIAYIEMKDAAGVDLGRKILKLAIIQEQQFLPNY